MLKESPLTELTDYIRHLDASEQDRLLRQLKRRDALFNSQELDKKQKTFLKRRKPLTESEIAVIVRQVRKEYAKKKT